MNKVVEEMVRKAITCTGVENIFDDNNSIDLFSPFLQATIFFDRFQHIVFYSDIIYNQAFFFALKNTVYTRNSLYKRLFARIGAKREKPKTKARLQKKNSTS